jgi:hypothetical protein
MIDPEALYFQLGHLIVSMPDLAAPGALPASTRQWLGRAYALVNETGQVPDTFSLDHHIKKLENPDWRGATVGPIANILYRALAIAELRAPTAVQGAFIPAGNAFDGLIAIGKVLQTVTTDVLIVDPYMDVKTLADFAVLAPEAVQIRLLADQKEHKDTLKPAVERWTAQHGARRPLLAKLAAARSLHDRLIIVDRSQVWVLTQSLNGFAARSPATIVLTDADTGMLKVAAYDEMWAKATAL